MAGGAAEASGEIEVGDVVLRLPSLVEWLYQPESGAEPVKKVGVLFRTGTNPVGVWSIKP
jgi:hypothetical protein